MQPGPFSSGQARIVKRTRYRDPSDMLLVPLYLILLGFFVVLTSLSNTDTGRRAAVLDSVGDAFAPPILTGQAGEEAGSDTPGFAASPAFFEGLSAILGDVLEPGAEIRDPTASALSFVSPDGLLFPSGRVTLRPDRQAFLQNLVTLALDAPPGEERQLQIFIGSDSYEIGTDGSGRFAQLKAGTVARALQQAGYPDGDFSVGILPGRAGDVLMLFEAVPPGSQKRAFSDRDGRQGGL